jgi:hypothetical protein
MMARGRSSLPEQDALTVDFQRQPGSRLCQLRSIQRQLHLINWSNYNKYLRK